MRSAPYGRWLARYRDAAGRKHSRHFARKLDAQRWLDEVTTSVITGQYVDPKAGPVTFETFYAEWAARQVWEATTVLAVDLAARSVPFAQLPLADLRRSHVEQWIKQMITRGLAPGTVRTRVNNVRGVLRAAVRDRVITSDPSDCVTLPTSDQVAAVLDAADERFRALVALAAFAGLRLGEAAGLQVGDVDYLRRVLLVRRQVQRAPGGAVEGRAPKYGGERSVYLPDELLELLSRHVAMHRPGDDPSRWVFEATPGQPPHQNTAGHQWRQACTRAGVPDVTLHDLWHFYASGLIAAGCDVVTVQRALGHARATTTLNTYAHLWPTAEDRTSRVAADLLTEVLPILKDHMPTNDAL